jgi:hypothetical protein
MPIHVVGPDDGEQSGGGPLRWRIIEDGSKAVFARYRSTAIAA